MHLDHRQLRLPKNRKRSSARISFVVVATRRAGALAENGQLIGSLRFVDWGGYAQRAVHDQFLDHGRMGVTEIGAAAVACRLVVKLNSTPALGLAGGNCRHLFG